MSVKTIKSFKWMVAVSCLNELTFWTYHIADNAEKFAHSLNDVTDYCYERMKNG